MQKCNLPCQNFYFDSSILNGLCKAFHYSTPQTMVSTLIEMSLTQPKQSLTKIAFDVKVFYTFWVPAYTVPLDNSVIVLLKEQHLKASTLFLLSSPVEVLFLHFQKTFHNLETFPAANLVLHNLIWSETAKMNHELTQSNTSRISICLPTCKKLLLPFCSH